MNRLLPRIPRRPPANDGWYLVPGTWYLVLVVETATQPGVKTSELHDDKMKTGTGTGMGSILLPAPLFLNKL